MALDPPSWYRWRTTSSSNTYVTVPCLYPGRLGGSLLAEHLWGEVLLNVSSERNDGCSFSSRLEQWLTAHGPKTLAGMGEVFAEKSVAVTVLLLMFVPAMPIPTGGVTHVFEVLTVVVAAQMVIGVRTLWLPQRWRQHELGATSTGKAIPYMVRRIRWFERLSRPRGASLLKRRWFFRLLGLVIVGFAVGAALAPPFSGLDTLPAMGAVLVALGIILDDVLVIAVGVTVGSAGVVVILTVGAALFRAIRHLVCCW